MEIKSSMLERLSIVSFNVRGLRNRIKRRSIFRHMRIKYRNSIVILQETHSKPSVERWWRSEWAGNIFFAHGTETGQGGVAILVPGRFPHTTNEIKITDNGRIVCVKIEVDENPDYILLVGVYGPAIDNQNEKCNFLDCLNNVLACHANDFTIIAGDFNIKIGRLDSDRDNFSDTRAGEKLRGILNEFSLQDAWRIQHPTERSYTWRRKNPFQQSRIDYIFLSSRMLQYNEISTKIETGLMSDHSVVAVDIELSNEPRGPGTWVYNNSLIDDREHVNEVRAEIREAKLSRGMYEGDYSKGVKIDLLLSNIRVLTIRRSKDIARKLRREENTLFKKANELESNIKKGDSHEAITEYESVKKELDDLKEKRGRAAILRSQSIWIEEGERSTNYFLRLAKKRFAQANISTLQKESGEYVRGNKPILEACATHYEALYSSKGIKGRSFDKFALDENAPRLTEGEKLSCEGPITNQECRDALRKMARNKTAGISGFTAEFFEYFWGDFGDIFVDYFNHAMDQGQLFISHRRGILTLIPKKDNQMLLKNKRPICLLDVVYKIIAKVIASRLEKVVGKLIHRCQAGFMKGRFIGENTRLISDVIDYCKLDNIEGALLALDFRNAFDSVEHDFILFALESFNFGPNFLAWIKLLYSNALLTVKNNGFTSRWFECSRGTFQGSPISGLLFNLAVEMFASRVRATADINGIMISGHEIKMTQYADDTTLFLKDSGSIQRVIEMLDDFRIASGLEINVQKCGLMWLGAKSLSTESVCGIAAIKKVKILGVWYSATERCYADNVEPVIKRMKNVIKSWNQRNLTIKGRIVVTKTLVASQLVYIATVIEIENVDLKEIQSLIMKFIWRGRPPKVAKGTLCQRIEQGGLNAVDTERFHLALRLSWIKVGLNVLYETLRHLGENYFS